MTRDYAGPAWVKSSNQPGMDNILRFPRLVFDHGIGEVEEAMVHYYLDCNRSFSVVVN